jgi:hypothetical protein
MSRLRLEMPAVADEIPRAQAVIVEFCEQAGVKSHLVEDIRLSVGEVCRNCVEHACQEAGGVTMTLEARVEGRALLVVVSDDGGGCPRSAKRPREAGWRLVEACGASPSSRRAWTSCPPRSRHACFNAIPVALGLIPGSAPYTKPEAPSARCDAPGNRAACVADASTSSKGPCCERHEPSFRRDAYDHFARTTAPETPGERAGCTWSEQGVTQLRSIDARDLSPSPYHHGALEATLEGGSRWRV